MIFSPTNVHLIASGRKTQTRRLVKRDERCRFVVGRSYAVQPGRGRPASLRIATIDVRHQLVGAISFDDARAEGFRTTDEFKAEWVRIHDRSWVARCELNRDGEPMAEFDLVERFGRRHVDRPVWVITFGLSREDTPRLLADRPGPDYVSSSARAMHETPAHLVGEAVSEAEQKWITAQAGTTFEQWRALEAAHTERDAQARSVDERVQAAARKALAVGVDVSREVWMVRKAAPEKAERWLVALERKAFALGRAA